MQNTSEQQKEQKNQLQVRLDTLGHRIYTFSAFPDHPFIVDQQYQLQAIKGWGTYGIVASGRNLKTGQAVAIKRINKIFDNPGDAKRILREIKILSKNKYYWIEGHDGHKITVKIVFQRDISLHGVHVVHATQTNTLTTSTIVLSKVPLTEQMMQFVLYQLLSAIHYMHSAQIIHRDMKPQNILINKKLQLKIADMNLARKEIQTEQVTYYVTSRPYRAPQIFINSNSNSYTKAIDIWAIGCILAEMLGKTVLFKGSDYIDQMRRFVAILGKPTLDLFPGLDPVAAQGLARVFKEIPDREKIQWNFLFPKASPQALDLLDHMLVYDSKARYTAEQCLNHPFLSDYKNRPKVKCKQVFDFSFDKIQLQPSKLRKAIYQQVQSFKQAKTQATKVQNTKQEKTKSQSIKEENKRENELKQQKVRSGAVLAEQDKGVSKKVKVVE